METTGITVLMERLARAVQRLQYADGLNPAQWEALRYLSRANRYSRSPSAVAEFLGTTKGTACQTLKALENKGCITRRPHPGDRRSVHLELTDQGITALEGDPLARLGDALEAPPTQLPQVRSVLAHLVKCLQGGEGDFGVCAECTHLCSACADAGISYRCGLTDEVLGGDEIRQICVNFHARAG